MPDLAVVIPVLNEASNLYLVEEAPADAGQLTGLHDVPEFVPRHYHAQPRFGKLISRARGSPSAQVLHLPRDLSPIHGRRMRNISIEFGASLPIRIPTRSA